MQGGDLRVLFINMAPTRTCQESFPKIGKSSFNPSDFQIAPLALERVGLFSFTYFPKTSYTLPSFSPHGHGEFWPPKILHVAKNEALDHVAKSAAPADHFGTVKRDVGAPHHHHHHHHHHSFILNAALFNDVIVCIHSDVSKSRDSHYPETAPENRNLVEKLPVPPRKPSKAAFPCISSALNWTNIAALLT